MGKIIERLVVGKTLQKSPEGSGLPAAQSTGATNFYEEAFHFFQAVFFFKHFPFLHAYFTGETAIAYSYGTWEPPLQKLWGFFMLFLLLKTFDSKCLIRKKMQKNDLRR